MSGWGSGGGSCTGGCRLGSAGTGYAAVIDFNYRHQVFGRGSGIFLHVATHSPTAGCVSLPERDLLRVLRWMRPGTRILIGPSRWLRGLKAA
jgi:hypothetical protein